MIKPYYTKGGITIYHGDTLETLKHLPEESVDTIITSPPYWNMRDYGVDGQIGLEPTLEDYLEKMLMITAELKRVLKKTGVMFWNHGDSYGTPTSQSYGGRSNSDFYGKLHAHGRKRPERISKCLNLQNYRLILRMIDEQGWILRNIIIWYKPNHMPSSMRDRFTNAYEPVFMLTKSKRYWFDLDAVRVPHNTTKEELNKKSTELIPDAFSKNPGDVWSIPTQPFSEAHFAVFPEKLVEPMILSSCPKEICKKCRKPRVRITKTEYITTGSQKGVKQQTAGFQVSRPYELRKVAIHKTVGWTDCGCNAGWKPCVVLDPFMGSGTTLVVAKRYGRQGIGIELNEDYIKMAIKRIEITQPKLF